MEALGDFPPSDERTVEVLGPSTVPGVVDRFPAETLAMRLDAAVFGAWQGTGVRVLAEGDEQSSVLLLPPERSCPLREPIAADQTAAVAASEDGAVWIAGGRVDGNASRRLIRLPSGETSAASLDEEMALRREGATAHGVGARMVIVGGAQGANGAAHDTFEVYPTGEGAMATMATLGSLQTPRRDHAATVLPGGRLLVVGGVAAGAADGVSEEAVPLASAEVIDPDSSESEAAGSLPIGLVRPQAMTLDDGTVLVFGGVTQNGPSARIFEFLGDIFVEASPEQELLPAGEMLIAAPLPGARVLVAGVRAADPDGESVLSSLTVLRRVPPFLGQAALEFDLVDLEAMTDLRQPRIVGLPDGRALVTGAAADSGEPRAFRVDVGLGRVEEADASRVPVHLVARSDATVAEIDAEGTSLRLERAVTHFDNPPAALLAEDLSLDAAASWMIAGADLVAQRNAARVDIPALRLASFSLSFEARGPLEVLFVSERGSPVRVNVRGATIGPSLCEIERLQAGPVSIQREDSALTISAGGASRTCVVEGLSERVGLAFVAATGTAIESLEVVRE